MKFRSIATAIVAAAFAFHSATHAKTFQIKGLTLGATTQAACGTANVTDNYGDIIRKYKPQAPALVEMGTQECEVEINTFGGHKTTGPAKLLFLDRQLILVKIELSNMTLSDFVGILKALTEDYGKPKRTISRPFVTDSWRAPGATLVLERLGREWDDNDATVILRQDSGYSIFESRSKTNSRILEALDKSAIKRDIR